MIAALSLIAMCLVFFILYEQTYGSWVTFTDRMLTKGHRAVVGAARAGGALERRLVRERGPVLRTVPWSTFSLLLAPLSFVVAASLSDRNRASRAPRILFALSCLLMLVLLVRDSVVLPQTAGSLTYLGAIFLVLLAPVFTALWGMLDRVGMDPSNR